MASVSRATVNEPPPTSEVTVLRIVNYKGTLEGFSQVYKLAIGNSVVSLPPMPELITLAIEDSTVKLPAMAKLQELRARDSTISLARMAALEVVVLHNVEMDFAQLADLPKIRELRAYQRTSILHLPAMPNLERLTLNRHAYVHGVKVRNLEDYQAAWLAYSRAKSAYSAWHEPTW